MNTTIHYRKPYQKPQRKEKFIIETDAGIKDHKSSHSFIIKKIIGKNRTLVVKTKSESSFYDKHTDMAEMHSIETALREAQSMNISRVLVLTDNQHAVNIITGMKRKPHTPTEVTGLRVRKLLAQMNSSIQYRNRTENSHMDSLCKQENRVRRTDRKFRKLLKPLKNTKRGN